MVAFSHEKGDSLFMEAAVIEHEALRLPEGERAVLIERLMESISTPSKSIREAWIKECDSRMEALQSGEITLIPTSEAISEVRDSLRA